MLIDTLGLLWGVVVHSAGIQDAAIAEQVLMRVGEAVNRWKVI